MNNIQSKIIEYQQVFAAKMLNIAFENVKLDPFAKKDSIFKSMLVDEYAKYIAEDIKIDTSSYTNLTDLQEV